MSMLDTGVILAVIAFVGIIYPHAIYPLVLRIVHRFNSDPIKRGDAALVTVDVVIAAYNEEKRIERCLESILQQDHPAERITIWVGDDGSSDGTLAVCKAVADRSPTVRIKTIAMPRSGKNGVITELVRHCTASVVVFTDADCIWALDALRILLAPFHDDRVGAVVGKNDRGLLKHAADPAERGEALYRSMEDGVNVLESEVASTVASNGALYAVRRELLHPLPDHRVADDWMNLLVVAQQRRRIIFEPQARVVEERVNSLRAESRRTIRTVSSGIAAFLHASSLMLPSAGWIGFFLISHRILRWASPLFVLLMIPATALTVSDPMIFGILFYGQALLYALALIGKSAARYGQHVPLASTCLFFVAMNISFLLGITRVLSGRSLDTWTPTESAA